MLKSCWYVIIRLLNYEGFFYISKLNHNDYRVQQRYEMNKMFDYNTLRSPEYPLF